MGHMAHLSRLPDSASWGISIGKEPVGARPSDGRIYGVSTANKIYTLDAMSGMATWRADLSAPVIVASRGYGIDFNPVADYNGASSLRLVSSSGDNFAINANTGKWTTTARSGRRRKGNANDLANAAIHS